MDNNNEEPVNGNDQVDEEDEFGGNNPDPETYNPALPCGYILMFFIRLQTRSYLMKSKVSPAPFVNSNLVWHGKYLVATQEKQNTKHQVYVVAPSTVI
jgi:hypothetical protein